MRLAYYAGASTAAAAACLLKAFHQRPNYYSATVYLSQSNACLLILTNLLLVIACSFIYGLQRLLYGPLRPIETEQLSEKAWYAVLDTLLAMPSFREDVGGWLLAMFTLLLAGKVWGWIGEGRVDILEQQPPANPKLFHLRLATSLIVSVVFDIWMLDFCVQTVLADPRPGMMVIFTFEFAILSVFSLFTLARYGLNVLGIRVEQQQIQKAIEERKEEIKAERAAARQNETADGNPAPADAPNEDPIEVDENEVDVPGWEEKRRYLFALEVFTDFIKLFIYIVFFTVSITFNGLPMHIMRDVYMTFASFSKRVGDFIAYRKATSDMNSRYPDATTEEIRGDSCIVCRETMVAWEQPDAQQEAQPAAEQPAAPTPTRRRDEGLRAKKLPCGHILHLRCLKAWLERQQVCPTCRRPVVTAETPAQPAQPGAPGGNPPAGGQPPQPPARRQNRARIFNLGPVRIGFLNGPGDQMNNIVRQIQHPNAGAGQNVDQQNQMQQQQGPNHLGLQQPYLPNAQAPQLHGTSGTGMAQARPPASVQFQLLEIEQRLMEQAHALNIEQQQLGTLRAMEAELARLRTYPSESAQASNSGNPTNYRRLEGLPASLIPDLLDVPTTFPMMQPHNHLPGPEALHGSATQQMGTGHEHLPSGMVLPAGWTVMPLQRSEGLHLPEMNAQIPQVDSGLPQSVGPVTSQNSAAHPNGVGLGNEEPTGNQQSNAGPTDDRGSPLFVPTNVPESNSPSAPAMAHPGEAAIPTASTAQTLQTLQQPTPWDSDSWSFPETPSGTAVNGAAAEAASSGADEAASSSAGKGKGKAVEVEDVPDNGS